jgi:hypothetical protein
MTGKRTSSRLFMNLKKCTGEMYGKIKNFIGNGVCTGFVHDVLQLWKRTS